MYWDPEVQLKLALQRQAELRCMAHRRPRAPEARIGQHRFSGLHLHFGSFIVAVGRTLHDEEARSVRPLHS
jgi:hypothetical protein